MRKASEKQERNDSKITNRKKGERIPIFNGTLKFNPWVSFVVFRYSTLLIMAMVTFREGREQLSIQIHWLQNSRIRRK